MLPGRGPLLSSSSSSDAALTVDKARKVACKSSSMRTMQMPLLKLSVLSESLCLIMTSPYMFVFHCYKREVRRKVLTQQTFIFLLPGSMEGTRSKRAKLRYTAQTRVTDD